VPPAEAIRKGARSEGTVETVSLSLVVPVFNSDRTLDELVDRIAAAASVLTTDWELVLVNDGSEDGSWERIATRARRDPHVRGVDLARNFGQHNALLAGIAASTKQVIVTLDDDLQNPPEEIGKLVAAITAELDVVYGTPIENRHPRRRRLPATTVRSLLKAINRSEAPAMVSGFRAIRGPLRGRLGSEHGRRVSLDSKLRRITDRFGAVPVRHDERGIGRSNYTLGMLIRHAATELAHDVPAFFRPDTGPSYVVRRVTGETAAGPVEREIVR
jgi:undecaprenyl-phosphate 4-deoxy-4-formamido-L-arabinose transferase